MELIVIFQIIVLIFSAIVHEVAHGAVAERLGDPTARLLGRLTLNPVRHIDPFGSIILPVLMFIASGGTMMFGWAKPVPYNPFNLKRPDRDAGLIAVAGPASNLVLAFVIGALYKLAGGSGAFDPTVGAAAPFVEAIVYINVILAVFNLVPLPPLDGSKVLFAILPPSARSVRAILEQYGMVLVIFFIFFGFRLILPAVTMLYNVFL